MSALQQVLGTIIIFGVGALIGSLPSSPTVRFRIGCFWFCAVVVACVLGFLTKGTP